MASVGTSPPRWLRAIGHLSRLPEVWRCARAMKNWAHVTRGYLKMGSVSYPMEVGLRGGEIIRAEDFFDLATAWVVFCRGEYCVPSNARLIVDLGANYGAFSLAAAIAAKEAKV